MDDVALHLGDGPDESRPMGAIARMIERERFAFVADPAGCVVGGKDSPLES
jgi:hypothetical protein